MNELSMESLVCRIEDGLARVNLIQAERGNPFDGGFCRDMCDLSVELSCRDDVRAVLLTAEGRFFSVGGDIRAFTKDLSQLPRIVKSWTADVHMAIVRFQRMNAPVVCALHGDVAGGAVSLAAMSDILIAAQGVKLNAAFSMIGFCADSGSTVSLTNRMGFARAKRFLLLSEVLEASEAMAAGLVDIVVPAADLSETAEAMAKQLAAGPTLAYGAIKRTFLSARTEPLEAQLEHEAQALAHLASTHDAREGLSAFAERRKPRFEGR
ncbi:enoyl-CoA hydratase/isomerase family protein [Mesorhizobium sp. L-8-3]|uniref:enoyl-CoA hydratase/isomerase family protein n=1 Tax=Mesorhizobium sp. L-8-3 TaxID=2744522 RepID=UPI0019282828|nr:enoyl-CoA hydratase-related protein [Mesorhizobium sp. L-8-3]BCH23451.1 enoyl-CoA hydratase [Mesorhizobium sp. L-8-3]